MRSFETFVVHAALRRAGAAAPRRRRTASDVDGSNGGRGAAVGGHMRTCTITRTYVRAPTNSLCVHLQGRTSLPQLSGSATYQVRCNPYVVSCCFTAIDAVCPSLTLCCVVDLFEPAAEGASKSDISTVAAAFGEVKRVRYLPRNRFALYVCFFLILGLHAPVCRVVAYLFLPFFCSWVYW